MISVRIPDEDYAYLQRLSELGGTSISQVNSELLMGVVKMYRTIFGDDVEGVSSQSEELVLRNMMRYALLEMSDALGLGYQPGGPGKVKGNE